MSKQSDLVGLAGDAANLETLAAGSAADIVALGNAYNAGALSNRNLIINGAMQVWQRGTSFSPTSTEVYTVDRFQSLIGSGFNGDATITQSTDVPTGQGFTYATDIAIDSVQTPSAGQNGGFKQEIERQNVWQLAYGTSNAKTVTLSFWVKSNKTGTYTVQFQINADGGTGSYYLKEYTINSADTWEKKTLTVPGNTVTAISTGQAANNDGYRVNWMLAVGSGDTAATDSWIVDGAYAASANQVNLWDNASNYWRITGVQLEVGTVATPFEHRSYAQELQLCMRYYQVAVGMWGFAYSNTATIFGWKPSVPFRASPSMGSTGNLKLDEPAIRNETQSTANFYSFNFDGNSGDHLMFGAGSFSGLNTGKPHYVRNDGGSTTWDAEL